MELPFCVVHVQIYSIEITLSKMSTMPRSLAQHYRPLILAGLIASASLTLFATAGQALSWSNLFDSPPPDPPESAGGSRGDSFCAIAPYNTGRVQSDRPTFIWQGATERIEIHREGELEPVWSAPVSEADILGRSQFEFESHLLNNVTYAVSPADLQLEPDQVYQLSVVSPLSSSSLVTFSTLSSDAEQQVEAQRTDLPPASDVESALERADFFAEAGLWSGFWGEVFSIQSPSAELIDVLELELKTICQISE